MKVPTYCRENDGLLQELLLTFQRYAELSGSVTMRAFSSQCFHDTKYFERNVRELFLTIARKYNTQLAAACTEAKLGERDQLAFLGIYARPERLRDLLEERRTTAQRSRTLWIGFAQYTCVRDCGH